MWLLEILSPCPTIRSKNWPTNSSATAKRTTAKKWTFQTIKWFTCEIYDRDYAPMIRKKNENIFIYSLNHHRLKNSSFVWFAFASVDEIRRIEQMLELAPFCFVMFGLVWARDHAYHNQLCLNQWVIWRRKKHAKLEFDRVANERECLKTSSESDKVCCCCRCCYNLFLFGAQGRAPFKTFINNELPEVMEQNDIRTHSVRSFRCFYCFAYLI